MWIEVYTQDTSKERERERERSTEINNRDKNTSNNSGMESQGNCTATIEMLIHGPKYNVTKARLTAKLKSQRNGQFMLLQLLIIAAARASDNC